MSDYHINIFYSDEDEGYIADIPDLDACSAFGSTPAEGLLKSVRQRKPGSRQPVQQRSRYPVRVTVP
jgi:hypothetical protein